MSSEFNIIKKYFSSPTPHADLGVGDDAALVQVTKGSQLVTSTDMSVVGTHFFADAAPYDIGWKSLAVNVSDMAAMGAQPKWATLAIALPVIDEAWLSEFSRGFFACANAFDVDLIGGDTTRGALNISVTIMGEVPTGKALLRSGAQVDDDIWVSGQLGSAALGLAHLKNKNGQGNIALNSDALEASIQALCRPMPRVALGLNLREIATSCIDISDGLAQDLGHIMAASNVGAEIFYAQIPTHSALSTALQANNGQEFAQYVLSGGDDYELCFTAAQHMREKIEKISATLQLPIARIGNIYAGSGLVIFDEHHNKIALTNTGYDHFGQ